ncbi:hypothetical protein E2C01_012234 [Portunus trituberculatus]|uniref:Gustatory receptor n=1 Tax=Portunus trituberculatus TaxID=210409 RepID=A0A5B7DDA4_PORTR|nr:hypothetical protein [Portunus trituberculatus]
MDRRHTRPSTAKDATAHRQIAKAPSWPRRTRWRPKMLDNIFKGSPDNTIPLEGERRAAEWNILLAHVVTASHCSTEQLNVIQESVLCEKKAMRPNKNHEVSQESPKDWQASLNLEQENEVSFMEANWFLLTMGMYFGFHNVKRNNSGALEHSYWGLLPILLHLSIVVAGFVVVQYAIMFSSLEYFQKVMLMPVGFGCGFCIEAYCAQIFSGKHYVNYLSEIESQDVRMKCFDKMSFIVAGTFVSSIIHTACTFLVTNLSRELTSILLIPVLQISFLPSLLDICMFSFNLMLKMQTVKLGEHIQQVSQWTKAEVSGVTHQWLLLCRLFRFHNQLLLHIFLDSMLKTIPGTQMFQKALHGRMLQSMVQVMTFTYALFMIDVMMKELRAQSSEALVVLSVVVPLLWAFLRSISLAFNGEAINHVYGEVLDKMRSAVVHSNASPNNLTEMSSLRRLLSHMEARPLALQVWGRDDLGAGVFVQNSGLVLTYLVMVVQMQPMPDNATRFFEMTEQGTKPLALIGKMGFTKFT